MLLWREDKARARRCSLIASSTRTFYLAAAGAVEAFAFEAVAVTVDVVDGARAKKARLYEGTTMIATEGLMMGRNSNELAMKPATGEQST